MVHTLRIKNSLIQYDDVTSQMKIDGKLEPDYTPVFVPDENDKLELIGIRHKDDDEVYTPKGPINIFTQEPDL